MNLTNDIVLYCPGLYPCRTGGMEIYNFYLVKSLLEKYPENEWRVLTSCSKVGLNDNRYLPLKNKLFFTKRNGLGALSTFISYLFSPEVKWKNVGLLFIPYTSNFRYNVIAFLLLKQIFGINYVVHIHGGGLKPWKPVWIQKLFFKKAKRIAGVSDPIIEEYSKRTGKAIEYLPPLVPFNKISKSKVELKKEKGLDHFNKILLFVGSLKPLKAPEILLKSFNELGSDFISENKIGLVFVGDGETKSELQAFVKKNCLNKFVHFAGRVPNEKIAEYYAMSDIFIISSWFEGTPIALLEAMSNSLFCIGSDVSGINSIIKNESNGLLFEKNNFQELKNLLKKVLIGKIDTNKMVNQMTKDYSENYDFGSYIDQMYNFINS